MDWPEGYKDLYRKFMVISNTLRIAANMLVKMYLQKFPLIWNI